MGTAFHQVDNNDDVVIGILALQGAFVEHQDMLHKISLNNKKIVTVLVRTVEDLDSCHGLIIPGGESTTMALVARASGLLEPLKMFVRTKPVWGTCAGAILLSQTVEGTKRGGQEVLGGISIAIARNGWGSQIESFEVELAVDGLRDADQPFTGIFIRAPVVLRLNPSPGDQPIRVIARLPPNLLPPSLPSMEDNDPKTAVVLRQGLHFLTTFHPELTQDTRFHEYFVKECVLAGSA